MYFRFEPFFRPMIWGSESWILSAYPSMESRVKGGEHEGKSLSELIGLMGDRLLGKKVYQRYGNDFPLLIKFIHARLPLSIQVHPSDELAQRQGKGDRGKTEMWYALPCQKDAFLLSGLRTELTPEEYKEHVMNHTIVDDVARYNPKEGDCFFIPAGRIHSIGSGCSLLEIQQASDITYRIYDYDRRDANGKTRELHIALAAESIDYTVLSDYETHYERKTNAPMDLVCCPYFETKAYRVDTSLPSSSTPPPLIDWHHEDRFLVLIVTSGEGELIIDGERLCVGANDVVLLPACTQSIVLCGVMTLISTTVE